MATHTADKVEDQVRAVTDDEVQQFREQGWVELKGLVSSQFAGELLAHIKRQTGLDYDELPRDHPDAKAVVGRIQEVGQRMFHMLRLEDEFVFELMASRKLGEAAARLTGNGPMRLFTDGVICKMPAWTEGLGGLMSGGTPWHQDMPPMPMDRPGGVQFWLAMCEITPEMGSMQHLTGSHHEPPIGNIQYTADQTLETERPDLLEKYEVSPPHHFQAGDVLAHSPLTLHYAQANQTDRLRWVYTSYRIPANTLYNGIPNPRIDPFGFPVWKPHNHPKFPVVSD
jgi:ectoine hydroxylase-related dioxygenase (phytanoyl-CoA dioxygenase family)